MCPTAGGDPARTPPHDQIPPGLRGAFDAMGYTFPTFLDARREHFGRMRQHGITVVSGTDAGIGPAKAHGGVRFAIADLVGAGWPIPEALATATSGAAASCGLSAVTGSLRHGSAADLLVVDGDLSNDVEALARPSLVLVRGRPASTGPTPPPPKTR